MGVIISFRPSPKQHVLCLWVRGEIKSAYVINLDCRKTPTTGWLAQISLQTNTDTPADIQPCSTPGEPRPDRVPPHIAVRASRKHLRFVLGQSSSELSAVWAFFFSFLLTSWKCFSPLKAKWNIVFLPEKKREKKTCTDRAGDYDSLQCRITSDWHKHLFAARNKPHTCTPLIKGT